MNTKHTKMATLLCVAALALTSCVERIDESTRYTFTGHTVASFLEEHEDVYSSFIYILDRGERLNLMKAYGQYTCFAPTNEAVERFLFEQDSIYKASLVDDNPNDIIWTGVTSTELTELSDSMCRVIAQTHIIPEVYLTMDLESDIVPAKNMNDRYLSLSYAIDENERSILIINGSGEVIARDEEVENGVVHTINAVLNPSTNMLPTQIEDHPYFHIMSEAIKVTGYADMMQEYKDESYTDGDKKAPNIEGNSQVPYPAQRYLGYSAFLEPDQLFFDQGIYNINDLAAKCAEWYPGSDPNAPLTSKDNPLNKFVGYHLIDRKLPYSRLVCYKLKTVHWSSEDDFYDHSDRKEYFETLNNRVLNLTMPRSLVNDSETRNSIYLNWYNEPGSPVADLINVKVYSANEFRELDTLYADFVSDALNGTIHPIDKILIYNEDVMAGRVLNTTVRIDFSSLLPELTNNDIRWNGFTHTSQGEIYIPHTYCNNLKVFSSETRHYILDPHTGWGNYQGDEMMSQDSYDIAYKLPPMPAGTYEIRFGYTAYYLRGIAQFYLDNEVTGIPVDLRITTDQPMIGFIPDAQTDDNGIQNDKEMKNRGYLKGPSTFYDYAAKGGNARDHVQIIRKVITTKYLSEGEHWVRFKNVFENSTNTTQFMHDYIEFVPLSYVRDESIPIEEKRK